MNDINVVSHYFSAEELKGKKNSLLPILFQSCKYDELKNAVANSQFRCCLIINQEGNFINIVTQGDVLRHSLNFKGNKLNVSTLLSDKKFPVVSINSANSRELFKGNNFLVIPIVDTKYMLIGVSLRMEASEPKTVILKKNRIGMVMAGGKGKRLYPLTAEIPKPLLKLGHQSILEHVLDSLNHAGIYSFILMAGYLNEKFLEFKQKSKRNLAVLIEDKPLGTGGPLLKWINEDRESIDNYLSKYSSVTLIVCNADLIFDVPKNIIDEFEAGEEKIMLIGRLHHHSIKFGVVSTDKKGHLENFTEKPTYEFLVNTGIYFFKIDKSFRNILENIPVCNIDMPNLLELLKSKHSLQIKVNTISGNYIDLGTKEDLIQVAAFFNE